MRQAARSTGSNGARMSSHGQEQTADADAVSIITGDDADLLFCGPAALTRAAFRTRVEILAARLPDAPFALNLCERRDHFIAGFCAALLRGQVTLLPPSRAPGVVDEVAMRHPGCYRIGDAEAALYCDVRVEEGDVDGATDDASHDWRIPADRLAMIGFTSGSTGTPSANPKTWGALAHTNAANLRALADLFEGARASIVATVPPQHMYGMEMSVLMPLRGPFAVHPGRPFFPADVARALDQAPAPRLLVTTPVHLRALLEGGVELSALAAIVTATAPLPVELARAAEARFACEVRELFGATETCVIAQRRTAREEAWHLYDDVTLHPHTDGTHVERASLAAPVLLADLLEHVDDGRGFLLRGRQADLLEIAGKRASLGDLTRRLQQIPGVRDAAMLQLDADAETGGVRRLIAFVSAPASLDDATILAALREASDPVFLPRRIVRIDALPRNDTGKLPRAALLALLART